MDKIFQGMIGLCVEFYVDNIVVNSDSFDRHIEDFLSFMLTHRGIEANPDKCQAITNMRSPQNIKEVQQLLGHLTTLSRFVPRLAERTRPMVQLFRTTSKFSWDKKCEEIFKHLKNFLSSPMVIQKSRPDQPILLYLVVSEEEVSATLVQEVEEEDDWYTSSFGRSM